MARLASLVLLAAPLALVAESGEGQSPVSKATCTEDLQIGSTAWFQRPHPCPKGMSPREKVEGCGGGEFSVCFRAPKNNLRRSNPDSFFKALDVPKNVKNFHARFVAASSDVDIGLKDAATGKWVVQWKTGVLHDYTVLLEDGRYVSVGPKLEGDYKDMGVSYSGDQREAPVKESVAVDDATTVPLELTVQNHGLANSSVVLYYRHDGLEGCTPPRDSEACVKDTQKTASPPSPPSPAGPKGGSSMPVGAIIAGVCGCGVCLTALLFIRRRRGGDSSGYAGVAASS